MPKDLENGGERRIMVSVKQKYLLKAGSLGCSDLEAYIDYLEALIDKKDIQYNKVKELLQSKEETPSATPLEEKV